MKRLNKIRFYWIRWSFIVHSIFLTSRYLTQKFCLFEITVRRNYGDFDISKTLLSAQRVFFLRVVEGPRPNGIKINTHLLQPTSGRQRRARRASSRTASFLLSLRRLSWLRWRSTYKYTYTRARGISGGLSSAKSDERCSFSRGKIFLTRQSVSLLSHIVRNTARDSRTLVYDDNDTAQCLDK